MIVALARPIAVVALPSPEGTVILSMDVSGSMRAEDLKPNRMEANKAAALSFVDKQPPGVRIGVVAFSDNASVVQSPTDDRTAVTNAINRLQPQRATAIGQGLLVGLNALLESLGEQPSELDGPGSSPFPLTPGPSPTPVPPGQFAPGIVVLITDGENNQYPDPMEVADKYVDRGVRVYTVGVGSPEGTILRIYGRSVFTRLDEDTLQQIAEKTSGTYYNAATEQDLAAVYDKLSSRLVMREEKSEITAPFTGLGAVLSVFAGILSLLWFNRIP
jgi:Ca-activated chloride channel family protein